MIREEFNPDIEVKFEQLLAHVAEKNGIIGEFLRVLREICDAEIFYSRSMDKFANNISKLMVGKDPLKEVFIIFERAVAAKSEQSMQLANNIKDDMIPFIESQAIDLKQQMQLKAKQRTVKDIRAVVTRKLHSLRLSENNYRRAYQQLKRLGQVQSRAEMQQRSSLQSQFIAREGKLTESITSYNNSIEQYMLHYTGICEKLSDIETRRKTCLRDAINKYMIFEISCIKNLEYNVPRYMKSLEKMSDRLIIQDKIGNMQTSPNLINLAKISVANYIAGLNDREKIDIPNSHKRILEIKKNTESRISNEKYHQLVKELYGLLEETAISYDMRVLKEIVYFARNVVTEVVLPKERKEISVNGDVEQALEKEQTQEQSRQGGGIFVELLLLDAIMCHAIFQNDDFWKKYQQKLFDIIDRQSRSLPINNKQIQISLNFLAADIDFLRLVAYHTLPAGILSKFAVQGQGELPGQVQEDNVKGQEFAAYLSENEHYLE